MADASSGRPLQLPDRGTTFVHETMGPPGAPTVILLHGLGATARLNWPGAGEALAPFFRVIALDHRGHGRGIRSALPFRLRDCADDAVRVADVLGVERFVAVGYSMGGPIALQARRRHPERVSGLVLCATAMRFVPDDRRASPAAAILASSLRLAPPAVRQGLYGAASTYMARELAVSPLFTEETRRHDPAALVEAGRAVSAFDGRSWVGELGCPAASVVTEHDRLVPRSRQVELAHALGAAIVPLAADHDVAVRSPATFLPALVTASRHVAARAEVRPAG